jgi:uncharacterized protein YegL
MRTSVFAAIAILGISTPLAVCAEHADEDADKAKAFQVAKREIQQQLRSRRPADRAEGMRRLEEFPLVDAAKLIVPEAFKGQPEEVRKAGFLTLLSFKGNPEICAFLLDTFKREATPKATRETIYPLLSVLLASDLPEIATTHETGMLMLLTLADDLGKQGDEESLAALVKLAKSDLMNREFPYRRSIVQAMTRIHEEPAVEALINLLGQIDGEARGDIVQHLSNITGEDFSTNHEKWAEWWKENRETFQFPSTAQIVVRKVSSGESNSLASYYGLPLYAKRLVFILDTSQSMSGQPLAAAKQELLYAINKLTPDTLFSVVVFNSRVGAWNTKLTPATNEAKKSATSFVMSQTADGQTATYDALQTAFGFDTEAIYFLTDGRPTRGKIVAPVKIVAAISDANHMLRKSVYTIGIGAERAEVEAFLKSLADKNFGAYRAVDR